MKTFFFRVYVNLGKKLFQFWRRPFFCLHFIYLPEQNRGQGSIPPILEIGQNWGKIASYPPNAQQRSASLGATPHTANTTMQWLDESFSEGLISRSRDPEWAPHSPDLNPPDFYLWEFLKDTVNENHPTSIAELKHAITSKNWKIRKAECVKVINNFAQRIKECLKQNGGHLEHVLK